MEFVRFTVLSFVFHRLTKLLFGSFFLTLHSHVFIHVGSLGGVYRRMKNIKLVYVFVFGCIPYFCFSACITATWNAPKKKQKTKTSAAIESGQCPQLVESCTHPASELHHQLSYGRLCERLHTVRRRNCTVINSFYRYY